MFFCLNPTPLKTILHAENGCISKIDPMRKAEGLSYLQSLLLIFLLIFQIIFSSPGTNITNYHYFTKTNSGTDDYVMFQHHHQEDNDKLMLYGFIGGRDRVFRSDLI